MEDMSDVGQTGLEGFDHSRRRRREDSGVSPFFREEPLDSGGLVPKHQKQSVTAKLPLLEIVQRLVYHLRPGTTLETIITLVAVYYATEPAAQWSYRQFKRLFTSQITISEFDPVAREILSYMSANIMNKGNITNAVLVSSSSSAEGNDGYMRDMLMLHRHRGHARKNTDEVQLLPPIGKKVFWVGFRPFLFERLGNKREGSEYSGESQTQQASIVLTTPGWNMRPLQDFVKTCHKFKVKNSAGTTTVFFAGSGGSMAGPPGTWSSVTKAVRKLETVDMDEKIKADLLRDAEDYYTIESKQEYADAGIPYRRGYLFYGRPGTGKTSFSAALAGHLKCDVYMINLASGSISDGQLFSLFMALPRKCVVVIEDVDCAGINRQDEEQEEQQQTQNKKDGDKQPQTAVRRWTRRHGRQTHVTLSGLLNAIDGNASQEGRLLIMTSNDPDSLDEALTRPGRIDKKVCFGNLNKQSARAIFKRLMGRRAIAKGTLTEAEVEEKADAFANNLPADEFTPAEVQNFLQFCRGDTDNAIADVDAWAQERRVEAAKKMMNDMKKNGVPAANQSTTGPMTMFANIPPVGMFNGNGMDAGAMAEMMKNMPPMPHMPMMMPMSKAAPSNGVTNEDSGPGSTSLTDLEDSMSELDNE